MFEDKFLHADIYISYKDTTIVVVCSDDEEIMCLETDGSKESWYFDVNKEKFSSLVAKLLNKDIGNNRKKDSKYFYINSRSNLMKVFSILDPRQMRNFLN
jgi:hypothetical protein